jgi:protein-tyrosine phosphatase
MLVRKVLVVCVGNICRSPVGEHLLRQMVPGLEVGSAGLGAMVGQPPDALAAKVAAANGISLDRHVARQFTADLGITYDLLLVMEPRHKREIMRLAPQLSGRVMLFDQWTGMEGIADPYRRSQAFHESVFHQIKAAAEAWTVRLKR